MTVNIRGRANMHACSRQPITIQQGVAKSSRGVCGAYGARAKWSVLDRAGTSPNLCMQTKIYERSQRKEFIRRKAHLDIVSERCVVWVRIPVFPFEAGTKAVLCLTIDNRSAIALQGA